MPFLPTRGLGEAGDGTQNTLVVARGLGGLNPAPLINVFEVLSAALLGPMVVRVTFSEAVKRLDPTASDDALQVAGWTTAGPSNVTLEVVLPVPEDPDSVDLFYRAALPAGTWTIYASAMLRAADGSGIVPPLSASFTVVAQGLATQVSPGDVDQRVLRKHLSPALRGRAWDAWVVAVDNEDQRTWQLARSIRDQMFVTTATGSFLVQRAGERGLGLSEAVGLADEAFRALTLTLTNRRVTQRAVQDLLEAFYGPGATRAGVRADVEPYELRDGDELTLTLGETRDLTVRFSRGDAARIARATAVEVVAVLNRAFRTARLHAYAEVLVDFDLGLPYVQIHADARGLSSSIRVTGGRAQVALDLPDLLFKGATGPFGTWDVAHSPTSPGKVRFTLSGTSPYDLSDVVEGDYVLVYGEEFGAAVRGTHAITEVFRAFPSGVLTQWFEVEGVFSQAGVTQAAWTSLVFGRPQLVTIHDNPRRAYSSQAPGRGVELVLPTTSPAVARGPGRASYRNSRTPLAVTALSRDGAGLVTVTTSVPHGLSLGNLVHMDGVEFGVTRPAIVAGTPSGGLGAGFL